MAKKPADRKAPKHPKNEKFTWTNDEGVEIVLPYMENLPAKLIMSAMNDDMDVKPKAFMDYILEQDKDGELTFSELEEILTDWQDQSVVDAGN